MLKTSCERGKAIQIQNSGGSHENKEWFSVIPLIAENRVFGRIDIHGAHDQKISHHDVIENILKVTCDIEQLMVETESAVPAGQLFREDTTEKCIYFGIHFNFNTIHIANNYG